MDRVRHLMLPVRKIQIEKYFANVQGVKSIYRFVGNGYVRSEAAVVIYLQKSSAAKRVYATVVHAKTNTDGNKEQGITFPSGEMQKKLIKEVYAESDVDPRDVAYVEAHGTGTKVRRGRHLRHAKREGNGG